MSKTPSTSLKALVSAQQPRPPARSPPEGARDVTIVAIGASAGGLEACTGLLAALVDGHCLAFILVQHLDPTHKSMMVELLASHTTMTVQQAVQGMLIEPDHLYIIPPGTYLSVEDGALHILRPNAPHGARLPFDFLLLSLAKEFGERAVCVVLSGSGGDGSVGLKEIKARGGLVIAQDPAEAGYSGMPTSAIETGEVDLIRPLAGIADTLVTHGRRITAVSPAVHSVPKPAEKSGPAEIIELLRVKTNHDFTLYKQGTLQRRITRRMAISGIEPGDIGQYLALLRTNVQELDLLSKDLLINVTSFFRDPKVFEFLAQVVVPDLIRSKTVDQSLRIWIAGCSTGEETYSLAMVFQEAIEAANASIKLQIFASDADPDAIATARDGFYPATIEADVSPERLAQFFSKNERGYKVNPELRSAVVFTVQDVLADPPFARMDMISCRNLLIYLLPEAQVRALSLFHFSLLRDGILLLGPAETVGGFDSIFTPLVKSQRVYRHIASSRPGEVGFSFNPSEGMRPTPQLTASRALTRQTSRTELFRRAVLEKHAPAAVLINAKHECLNSLGPTQRYLQVASGEFTSDLLAMVQPDIRSRLWSAIHQASQGSATVILRAIQPNSDRNEEPFRISIEPMETDDEQLLVVCFLSDPEPGPKASLSVPAEEVSRVAELESTLSATRAELHDAVRRLVISAEEQKATSEEALSVNEEYQSTNEELLTSKEELQALNEELSALNSQLQETLERSRTTSNDLQNILYSTDVATLFLDANLNIRFFTPATRSLFRVITSDVGRPLADLHSLSADNTLLVDAQTVLGGLTPVEREIEAQNGAYYVRRILPYHTHDSRVEGVVITFTDITERRLTARALEAAMQRAELATAAKSRFLAAASHDLRQPLQTLKLIQGLLAKKALGETTQQLVGMLNPTLSAMSGMLNTLLDMDQIDTGAIKVEDCDFEINNLLDRLRDEFTYHADARGLTFHVVSCGLSVHSDPRLLERILRNLLSNALKYTEHGKVLLGCRRHGGAVRIEVWDTGLGIPDEELLKIFEEYHQLDNSARERALGLGLGLAVVHRLGKLLGHRVSVHSHVGKGSVFSIEVPIRLLEPTPLSTPLDEPARGTTLDTVRRTGTILIVDDDAELRRALSLLLTDEGHQVAAAADGAAALDLVTRGKFRPQLILSDYNLPNGMNGLQVVSNLRRKLHRQVPVVILTGDISREFLQDIVGQDCAQLTKPIKSAVLTDLIEHLLPPLLAVHHRPASTNAEIPATPGPPMIFIVDDDSHIRALIRRVLEDNGQIVTDYATCEAFLDEYRPGREACLLVDAYLPGMHGLELLQRLNHEGYRLPTIMMTGSSDVPLALQAMQAGASDFIEKPINGDELIASVKRALEQSSDLGKRSAVHQAASQHVASLTDRQREIMGMVLAGHPSKNIAADLHISQRTVENHRASIMKRTGSRSLPDLARLALAAQPVDPAGHAINGAVPVRHGIDAPGERDAV